MYVGENTRFRDWPTCTRCHRPLSKPTLSGMGRVCAKKAPKDEGDLFGDYDLDKMVLAAQQRLSAFIEAKAAELRRLMRKEPA
jgi:hypothetical protein